MLIDLSSLYLKKGILIYVLPHESNVLLTVPPKFRNWDFDYWLERQE